MRGAPAAVLHLLAGTVAVVAASAFVGFGGYFFIDEAALYGQLEVMDDGKGWTIPRPFPDRDIDAVHVPMARSDVAEDEFAPFAKHPVHVVLARAAWEVGGEVGVRVLSAVALVGAAAGAAVLAGAGRRAAAAFWLTLGASPLLFDANLVVAHTLGAAVAASMFALVVRAPRRWSVFLAVGLLSCTGALLRNEFLLLSAAGGLVVGFTAIRRRSTRDAALAGALAGGGALAYLFEPLLVRWAIGGRPGLDRSPTAGSSVGDIIVAAGRSLFEIEGLPGGTTGVLAIAITAVLVAVVAFTAGRPAPDLSLLAGAGTAGVVAAAIFAGEPHLLTGLVWAFPAVLVLVATAHRKVVVAPALRPPLAIAGVFAVTVALTQYSQGGGLEWGWRYVAIAVPLVTPAIADVSLQLWERRRGVQHVALACAAIACVLVQIGGLRVARALVADTEAFLDRTDSVATEAAADWVVSLDASFGRFAYPLSTDGKVATAADGSGPKVLRWLRKDGVGPILLVWRFDEDPPIDDLAGYRRTPRRWYIASEYRGQLLVPR